VAQNRAAHHSAKYVAMGESRKDTRTPIAAAGSQNVGEDENHLRDNAAIVPTLKQGYGEIDVPRPSPNANQCADETTDKTLALDGQASVAMSSADQADSLLTRPTSSNAVISH
jgi:hypothetical protein